MTNPDPNNAPLVDPRGYTLHWLPYGVAGAAWLWGCVVGLVVAVAWLIRNP